MYHIAMIIRIIETINILHTKLTINVTRVQLYLPWLLLSIHPCMINSTHAPLKPYGFMLTAYSVKHAAYRHQPPMEIRRQIRGLELLPHLWPSASSSL
jgi:hypothetical protein